jgi:hypothetical protein
MNRLFDTVSNNLNLKGLFGGTSGCIPLIGVWSVRGHPHPNQQSRNCNNFILNSIELSQHQKIQKIILVARWDYYIDSLNSGDFNDITDSSMDFGGVEKARDLYAKYVLDTFNTYSNLGKEVVVVFQVPNQEVSIQRLVEDLMQQPSVKMIARLLHKFENIGISEADHLKRQELGKYSWREILTSHKNRNLLTVVDPTSYFCENGTCPILNSGGAFYTDTNHASDYGLLRLEPEIRAILNPKTHIDDGSDILQ